MPHAHLGGGLSDYALTERIGRAAANALPAAIKAAIEISVASGTCPLDMRARAIGQLAPTITAEAVYWYAAVCTRPIAAVRNAEQTLARERAGQGTCASHTPKRRRYL